MWFNYDWYLFVDVDIYVLWFNLVEWLKQLKLIKKVYLGSVMLINNFSFGYGGLGYIVSKVIMDDFIGNNLGVGNQYDMRVKCECCGDYIFVFVFKDKMEVGVQQMVSVFFFILVCFFFGMFVCVVFWILIVFSILG